MTHLSPGTLSGRFTVGSLGSPRSREEGALQPGGTPPTAPCDFSLSQACPAASFLGFVLPVSGRRKGYVLLPLLVFNPPPPLCSVLCLLLHPRVCLTPLVPSAPSCPREPGLPGRAPGPAVPRPLSPLGSVRCSPSSSDVAPLFPWKAVRPILLLGVPTRLGA